MTKKIFIIIVALVSTILLSGCTSEHKLAESEVHESGVLIGVSAPFHSDTVPYRVDLVFNNFTINVDTINDSMNPLNLSPEEMHNVYEHCIGMNISVSYAVLSDTTVRLDNFRLI